MQDRYSRVFTNPVAQYQLGCPIMIQASSILKDSETNKIYGQIKLKNIGTDPIVAVFINIRLLDVTGSFIRDMEYQFLDLNEARDGEFGYKTPIAISEVNARALQITTQKIVKKDGTIWVCSDSIEVVSIPAFKKVSDILGQEDYKKYLELTKLSAAIVPFKQNDIWYCSCGSINHDSENNCHVCHNLLENQMNWLKSDFLNKDYRYFYALEQMNSKDPKTIRNAITILDPIKDWRDSAHLISSCEHRAIGEEARIQSERYNKAVKDANSNSLTAVNAAIQTFMALGDWQDSKEKLQECEAKRAQLLAKKKKNMKISLLAAGVFVLAILLIFMVGVPYAKHNKVYKEAISSFEQGKYVEAKPVFKELGNFRQSKKYTLYIEADEKDKNDIETQLEALKAFKELGNWRDAADKAEKCKEFLYPKATSAWEQKNFELAISIFNELDDYKDTADYKKKYQEHEEDYIHYSKAYEAHKGIYTDSRKLKEAYQEISKIQSPIEDSEQLKETYRDEVYRYGKNNWDAGNYDDAVALFDCINDYKDAGNYIKIYEDNKEDFEHYSKAISMLSTDIDGAYNELRQIKAPQEKMTSVMNDVANFVGLKDTYTIYRDADNTNYGIHNVVVTYKPEIGRVMINFKNQKETSIYFNGTHLLSKEFTLSKAKNGFEGLNHVSCGGGTSADVTVKVNNGKITINIALSSNNKETFTLK